jgi:hypothetical protein
VHTELHTPTRFTVTFDDGRAVAGAGLVLVATLSEQLDTYAQANKMIDLGGRPGHALPGRKVLTLVHAMVAGPTASMTATSCAPARLARSLGTG